MDIANSNGLEHIYCKHDGSLSEGFEMVTHPTSIYHFEKNGIYIYASTEEILLKALQKMPFRLGKGENVDIKCGDILTIDKHGNQELDKLISNLNPGDAIIFDSVSRMNRNAEEGFNLYEELFRKDITLIFLKEPHINTDT